MERIASFTENKKASLRYLQKRQRMQKKAVRRKGVKAVSEAWSHCSKADARGRKKNRTIKLQKLYMDKKKKKAAIERTTQLVAKKQLGWLYSFAKTCMHSNCSGNLQGNCGMAFGRVCSSSFEGSPLSLLACFFFFFFFALGRIFD